LVSAIAACEASDSARRWSAAEKRHDLAGLGIHGVDQLQHADDRVLVVLHRHGEEGLRAVAGALVELAGAGEIEALASV
jgi:hypothetical protein